MISTNGKLLYAAPAFAMAMLVACGSDDDDGPATAPDSGGSQLLTVSGTVVDRQMNPVSGLTVEVVGEGGVDSTTSGAEGRWSLKIPPGENFIRASGADYWAGIHRTSAVGDFTGVELVVFADFEVAGADALLDDREFDEANGILIVEFPGDTVGGRSATLSAGSDAPFTFDATDTPVASDETLVPGGELLFTNVEPGNALATLGASTAAACALPSPSFYPVAARSVTVIQTLCSASGR